MMQGDAYLLGISILNNAGMPVTPADVADVESTLGHLKKKSSDASLSCMGGVWMFPLSQSETFGCLPAAPKAQVRVKWANGVIEGKPLYGVRIDESISKEVL